MTKFLIYIVATAILVLLGTDAYLVATGKGTPTTVPCCESWEQFGGTTEELRVTVPVADRYNAWLHGADEE